MDAQFWTALLEIIAVNIVLSGDNAVVIALACRSLPPHQQRIGIILGAGAAILMRVAFTAVAATLMTMPTIGIIGGALLLWIGWKLLTDESDGEDHVQAAGHLWGAVRTVLIADAVMSLDNVIAVAGAAQGSLVLLLFGLAVSIPLIVWSSQVILRWMERWPWIVLLGAGLLGYVAGQMIFTDPGIVGLLQPLPAWSAKAAGAIGALLVVIVGRWLEQRILARQDVTIV